MYRRGKKMKEGGVVNFQAFKMEQLQTIQNDR